jgi:hypothetical protein
MVRYAIPLLPLTALPAAVTIGALAGTRRYALPAAAAAFALATVVVTGPSLVAYGRAPSPPMQAIAHLNALVQGGTPVVVAGNHVYARYVPALNAPARVLPIPSWREWREMNTYWLEGGVEPVWFLRNPDRRSLDLVDPEALKETSRWEWPAQLRRLLSGSRPTQVDLVRIERPRWFVGSGYVDSGEAGTFEAVAHEPSVVFVRGDIDELMLLSVRSRGAGPLRVLLGNRVAAEWNVSGTSGLPVRVTPASEPRQYVPLRLEAGHGLEIVGIATLPADRNLLTPVRGLFDVEPDETGEVYRWISQDSAFLAIRSGAPARLTLRGRIPVQYYDVPPRELRVTVDDGEPDVRALEANRFTLEFALPETVPGAMTRISLHVSDGFSPDEVLGNGDTRQLSLMIYGVELR